MGMFDTIEGTGKCSKCSGDIFYEVQTKSFECMLDIYTIGDTFPMFGSGYHDSFEELITCKHCNHKDVYSFVTVNDAFTHIVSSEIGHEIQKIFDDDHQTISVIFSKKDLLNNLPACMEKLKNAQSQLSKENISTFDATDYIQKINRLL